MLFKAAALLALVAAPTALAQDDYWMMDYLFDSTAGHDAVLSVVEKFALNNGNFFAQANKKVAKNVLQQFYGGSNYNKTWRAFYSEYSYPGFGDYSFSPWDAPNIGYFTYSDVGSVDYTGDDYQDSITDGGEDQYDGGNSLGVIDMCGTAPGIPYTQSYSELYAASTCTSYTTWKLSSGKAFLAAFYNPSCTLMSVFTYGETGFDDDGYAYLYDFSDTSGDFAVFTRMTCCDDGTLTHMMFVPMSGQRFSDDWEHRQAIYNTSLDTYGYYSYSDYTDNDFDKIYEGAGQIQTNAPATTSAAKSHVGACTVYYLLFMGKTDAHAYDEEDDYMPAFRDSTLELIADAFVDTFSPAWWK